MALQRGNRKNMIRKIQKALLVFLIAELFVPVFSINNDCYSLVGSLKITQVGWVYIMALFLDFLFLFTKRISRMIEDFGILYMLSTLMGIIFMRIALVVIVAKTYDNTSKEIIAREEVGIHFQMLAVLLLLVLEAIYAVLKWKKKGNV